MSSPPADSYQIRSRLLNRLGIHEPPPKVAFGAGGGGGLPVVTASEGGESPSSVSGGGIAAALSSQPMTAAQHRRLRILRGMGVGYTFHHSPPDGSAIRPPLNGVVPFNEPLKNHCEQHPRRSSNNRHNHHSHSHNFTGPHSPTSSISTSDPDDSSNPLKNGSSSLGSPHKKSNTRIAFQDSVEVIPIPTRYEYSDRIKSRIWSNRHELQENAERNALEFAAEGWNWRTVTEDEGMYICSSSGELVHPIHLQHLTTTAPTAPTVAVAPQHQSEEPHYDQDAEVEDEDEEEDEDAESGGRKGLERGAPVH